MSEGKLSADRSVSRVLLICEKLRAVSPNCTIRSGSTLSVKSWSSALVRQIARVLTKSSSWGSVSFLCRQPSVRGAWLVHQTHCDIWQGNSAPVDRRRGALVSIGHCQSLKQKSRSDVEWREVVQPSYMWVVLSNVRRAERCSLFHMSGSCFIQEAVTHGNCRPNENMMDIH